MSIIIPARPGQVEIPALDAVAALRYPPEQMEILVVRGRQPAVQRNAALKEARHEVVYFLDDDALPEPGNLERGMAWFQSADLAMVGGPNVCPVGVPLIERVFAVVLASWIAMGPSRARYDAIGRARASGEKELILCNLMARRQPLLDAGGFDEALYPNEENALMDVLQQRGSRLVYDPEFVVHRRPRPTLGAFARMMFRYGKGRAEQFRRHPTFGSALNFAPPLFCLYLIALPWLGWIGLAFLACYALALAVQTMVSAGRHGLGRSVLAAPLLVLTHGLYGLGFWRGLLTRFKGASAAGNGKFEVSVERIEASLNKERNAR